MYEKDRYIKSVREIDRQTEIERGKERERERKIREAQLKQYFKVIIVPLP